ncbi:MAG TPA: type II toxin-antitoxin system VapC family toxin [Stellaceae bacterium]|nr:type II toxin-antitoxin system VapC family toxin [Stellaceae bacterium]
MGASLLLDTHIALWLDSSNPRLAIATRDLIDRCWQDGGTICLSAVSAWEIALLVALGRIDLDIPPRAWIERFIRRPGIVALPLAYQAACRSYKLRDFEHRDPGDRLLIATAVELGCPLVTYDSRITRFAERYGSAYGFSVAA